MSLSAPPARRSRRGSGAVTLHDVAKLAGVAPITASRALNTPEQVSAEVLKKVSDAVTRTGYVPNLLAGGLASTRSRLVAAVVPTISGPVFLESVQSLTEALASYEGTCVFVTHDRQMVSQVAGRVLEMSPGGIRELSPDEFSEGQFLLGHKTFEKAQSR